MPQVDSPPHETNELPSISEYRNYFAIRSGVSLGVIDITLAKALFKLSPEQSLDDVDFTKLDGYEELSPFRLFRGSGG